MYENASAETYEVALSQLGEINEINSFIIPNPGGATAPDD
jgi:hypothetical protein